MFYHKEQSAVKMVALTDAGSANIVWYSPIKQNEKIKEQIVTGMLRRFEKTKWFKKTRCLQFYDNFNNTLLFEYKAFSYCNQSIKK